MSLPALLHRRAATVLAGVAVPALLAAAATLAAPTFAAAPTVGSERRWVPGATDRLPVGLTEPEAAAIASRATNLAARLGLQGVAGPARRVADTFLGRTIDTVEVRVGSRLAGVVDTEAPGGALRAFSNLTWLPAMADRAVDAGTAPGAAAAFAAIAGVDVPPLAPTVRWDDAMAAWTVRWPRLIDGVPAPHDGVTVWVRAGGQLAGIARLDTPLAPAPVRPVAPTAAEATARAWAHRLGLDGRPGFGVGPVHRAWVSGNGFVDPRRGDAPEPLLRSTWVVTLTYQLPPDLDPHLVDLYVDAGTGVLIGGDETA